MSPNQGYPQQQDPRYMQQSGGYAPQQGDPYKQSQDYQQPRYGFQDEGYAGWQAQQPRRSRASQRMQPEPQGMSAMAIVGLALGIVALLFSWMPIVNNFAFFIALLALVFAVVGIVGTGAGKKRGRGLAIAGLALAVISAACVLGTQAMYGAAIDSATESLNSSVDRMTGDATDEILGTEVDVKLGAFASTKDQYGIPDTALPVTVTNLLDESKTYVVEIEAVDSSGARIDTSTVYANSLGAGQSQTLDAFSFVTTDMADKLEGAQFKVLEVSQY